MARGTPRHSPTLSPPTTSRGARESRLAQQSGTYQFSQVVADDAFPCLCRCCSENGGEHSLPSREVPFPAEPTPLLFSLFTHRTQHPTQR